nr:hypothetical protein CFP56_41519 [Quercus suber]
MSSQNRRRTRSILPSECPRRDFIMSSAMRGFVLIFEVAVRRGRFSPAGPSVFPATSRKTSFKLHHNLPCDPAHRFNDHSRQNLIKQAVIGQVLTLEHVSDVSAQNRVVLEIGHAEKRRLMGKLLATTLTKLHRTACTQPDTSFQTWVHYESACPKTRNLVLLLRLKADMHLPSGNRASPSHTKQPKESR